MWIQRVEVLKRCYLKYGECVHLRLITDFTSIAELSLEINNYVHIFVACH